MLTAVETAELPKMGQALGSGEQPAVSGVLPASPAPVREEVAAAPAPSRPTAPRRGAAEPTATRSAPAGGVIARLLGWFRGPEAPAATSPAPARNDSGNENGNRSRRDERGNRNGNGANATSARQPRRETAPPQGSPKTAAQQQARSNRQRNN
jgi:ribonuclease E